MITTKKALALISCWSLCTFSSATQAGSVDVVEYYHPILGHYFITSGETQILDNGGAGGNWIRTGQSFKAWPTAGEAPSSAKAVCRFYGRGPNSHFYTASPEECEYVKANDPGWEYEGIAFYIETPVNGVCASGVPVLRSYNNGFANNDSNHRYMTLNNIQSDMTALGWAAEGVAMCSTEASTNNGQLPEQKSVTVATNTAGSIATSGGAKLEVPVGAVANTPSGESGVLSITMGVDTTAKVTIPVGTALASKVYKLSPSGHVFQTPVAVTLPVTSNIPGNQLAMYIQNEDGTLQNLGGEYDAGTNTVKAYTTHFSSPFLVSAPRGLFSNQCILVDNTGASAYENKLFCVDKVNYLTFPDAFPYQSQFQGLVTAYTNQDLGPTAKWHIPPGNYDVCIEEVSRTNQIATPKFIGSKIIKDVFVPYDENGLFCSPTIYVSNLEQVGSYHGLSSERCACNSEATPGSKAGALNVSLTWNSSASPVDLDIRVTDPNGELIDWDNTSSSTGGSLDWDNQCYNYANGKTENISWTTAPKGNYVIEVDFYEACNTGGPSSIPFTVNVTINGQTTSYPGTAYAGKVTTVRTITVQ